MNIWRCSIIDYKANHVIGLTNFWPFDSSTEDVIGGQKLKINPIVDASSDRFNKPNSAIYFNKGYGEFPEGVYFSSEGFTIMLWFKVIAYNSYQRIFDFGNGKINDNLLLTFNSGSGILLYPAYGNLVKKTISKFIPLQTWTHLSVTFSGDT